ncbi:MAG TPA: SMC-Scp complex subunit ScpB, partial [Thermoanaerobaculia bacterium]|nr:SMC-Scp complex subunit ScpB [Thermoanaerobaculia bacterium]
MTDRDEDALRLRPALEALLFSSGKPIPLESFAEMLGVEAARVEHALNRMAETVNGEGRGIRLEAVGGGWRFVTRPEFDGLLRRYFEVTERSRLSLAALETLAIIAYRQPITAPEISELRSVNSAAVLKTLFEKKLITTAGKKPVVGTPFFYRTTREFLVRFGLNDLAELPKPEEIDEDLAAEPGAPPPLALAPPLPESDAGSGAGPSGETIPEDPSSSPEESQPSEPVG